MTITQHRNDEAPIAAATTNVGSAKLQLSSRNRKTGCANVAQQQVVLFFLALSITFVLIAVILFCFGIALIGKASALLATTKKQGRAFDRFALRKPRETTLDAKVAGIVAGGPPGDRLQGAHIFFGN